MKFEMWLTFVSACAVLQINVAKEILIIVFFIKTIPDLEVHLNRLALH